MTTGLNKIYRLLDANLNRAVEGCRVIEDYFRFISDNSQFSAQIKSIRHKIATSNLDKNLLLQHRDTSNDVGTGTYIESEGKRDDRSILHANISRVQEALRVLEEYSKLVEPNLGSYFKDIRYELYVLESALASHPLKEKLKEATLYLVTEPSDNMLSQVEKALQGGIKIVQLREKNALGDEFLTKAKALRELTRRYGALFIVNDRADIAILSDADGLHIGQEDMPIAEARKLIGSRIIGVSTHKIEEARKAAADGADYIGMGPVYATPTKEGRVPVGLDYIRQVMKEIDIPAYAIGGISLDNIDEVKNTGATRFAVVREIMRAGNPDEVVKKLSEKISKQEVRV